MTAIAAIEGALHSGPEVVLADWLIASLLIEISYLSNLESKLIFSFQIGNSNSNLLIGSKMAEYTYIDQMIMLKLEHTMILKMK